MHSKIKFTFKINDCEHASTDQKIILIKTMNKNDEDTFSLA